MIFIGVGDCYGDWKFHLRCVTSCDVSPQTLLLRHVLKRHHLVKEGCSRSAWALMKLPTTLSSLAHMYQCLGGDGVP